MEYESTGRDQAAVVSDVDRALAYPRIDRPYILQMAGQVRQGTALYSRVPRDGATGARSREEGRQT